MNTYLHLDLTTGRQRAEPVTGWGGPLLALHHLRSAISDPPFALVTSVVAGLGGAGLARCAAVGVSPLSGAVAETRAEGPFAGGLRASGVIGISLTGAASSPSYVVVASGRASIHSAEGLWGLRTGEATDLLIARHGPHAAVAVIGPAGEAGARYANVVTCRYFPLPRLGFGAILGAKNIKAIICVPGEPGHPADPAALAALTADYAAQIPTNPLASWQHKAPGFGAWPGQVTEPGRAPVRNFADTTTAPAAWPSLAPAHFAAHLTWDTGGCPGCPNDCVKGFAGAGLHQEAIAMLGPNLGFGDLKAILAINARCQELGLDPVSFGGTLACLLEATSPPTALPPDAAPPPAAFAADAASPPAAVAAGAAPLPGGAVSPPAAVAAGAALLPGGAASSLAAFAGGAVSPPGVFGGDAAVLSLGAVGVSGGVGEWLGEMAELAARPGHPLGEGAARLAERLGRPELAMVSRGVELPPFDPRVQRGLGLMYAASPIGPRYDAIEHDLDFDPVYGLEYCYAECRRMGITAPTPVSILDLDRTVVLADLWSGLDALLVCPYASTPTRPLTLDRVCALVAAVTGIIIEPREIFALGRERLTLQQEINDLLGVPPAGLPDRFFDEPVSEGVFAGAVLDRKEFAEARQVLQQLWKR